MLLKKILSVIYKNSNIIKNKKILHKQLFNNYLNFIGGDPDNLIISYKNIEYKFEKSMIDDNHYVLYSTDELECVSILIDKENKLAEIHGISNYDTCTLISVSNQSIGSLLLKITIKMLKKYKEILEINKITLTDNTIKKCKYKDINLSMMLTLINGDTWYGKYGFIPSNKKLISFYENNKKIINNIKLKDIDLIKYLKLGKLDKSIIIKTKEFISSHQELLLKDYLTKFLKEYDKTCTYFYNFYEELFYDLQLYNFSHNPFELTI